MDTSGVVQLDSLTCQSEHTARCFWYEPTPIRVLKSVFSALPRDLSSYTFVDFGSGKGRAILYASNYNFRKIIGVEFAKELDAIAQQNIRSYRSARQTCFDASSVCMDATEFPIPEGETVFYFFRPFHNDVMARVLRNIEESYERNPRSILLLYYHPRLDDVAENSLAFLHKLESKPMPLDLSARYRRKLVIYGAGRCSAEAH